MPERDTGAISANGESIPSRREVGREEWWQCMSSGITKTGGQSQAAQGKS